MSPHALLSADEIDAARSVLAEAGLLAASTRFAYLGLDEPPKEGAGIDERWDASARRIVAVLLDRATGVSERVVVDLGEHAVIERRTVDPLTEGQPAILDEEFDDIEAWLRASEPWRVALERRGVDPDRVRAAPLAAGNFGREEEAGVRLARVLGFVQLDDEDLPWSHPVDGLLALVDLTRGEVVEVRDFRDFPVPQERGQWDAAPHGDGPRTDLKPIEIRQPEGTSVVLDGNRVTWADWDFEVGFDVREGLILHDVAFTDGGRRRPVLHRASVPEMVVPYADPSPTRSWINYFDQGEYSMGRYTNSLELGCDCVGEITYLDAVVADERGRPRVIPNAICIHEEDVGVLWKHTDMFNGMRESRRQRRIVVSSFVTVGNYDYGFFWYLYLDGTIELEAKATGVVFASAYPGPDGFATQIAPGLGAPFHQHLFCARLDLSVDGHRNRVVETEVERVPVGPDNPEGNAFRQRKTTLRTERDGCRMADNTLSRYWLVQNPDTVNAFGENIAYGLFPEGQPALLADPSSTIAHRAAFATQHLWVTRYDHAQRWPAGEFVNQSVGGQGLPRFVASDLSIDGEDDVLWHTFGLTHFPRPEDWPIMPVDRTGFVLKPLGFFDRNPALDAPLTAAHEACAHGGDHSHGAGHAHGADHSHRADHSHG